MNKTTLFFFCLILVSSAHAQIAATQDEVAALNKILETKKAAVLTKVSKLYKEHEAEMWQASLHRFSSESDKKDKTVPAYKLTLRVELGSLQIKDAKQAGIKITSENVDDESILNIPHVQIEAVPVGELATLRDKQFLGLLSRDFPLKRNDEKYLDAAIKELVQKIDIDCMTDSYPSISMRPTDVVFEKQKDATKSQAFLKSVTPPNEFKATNHELVIYYAYWCSFCGTLQQELESASMGEIVKVPYAGSLVNILVRHVNVDFIMLNPEDQELMGEGGIPEAQFRKKGQKPTLLKSVVGYERGALQKWLQAVIASSYPTLESWGEEAQTVSAE